MKSYDNKKFYNYKTSHKRKKRTQNAQKWWKLGSEYTREKRREYRTKSKVVLRKKLNNELVEFPLYKKTMWWDA
ncbi:hypothetical protein SAMN04487910_3129 [Aquimarina amphilecti]|uniref:Uncharacterized protein n=1 Tax=Aquimarina amphilecti TaxID=1038014 RepID=A0A1H7SE03_AQUAM|nr:hypothetical protein [Aquimarina amphilecti]SEL70901.1 hypothetical protein SAMN04487910_3129 [Aquimarina amphilecti]